LFVPNSFTKCNGHPVTGYENPQRVVVPNYDDDDDDDDDD
jgi:hypothetical protein